MSKMASEFRTFILRGNVVDLAVGVVIGAVFADVVKAFTAAFITPLVSALGVDMSTGVWFLFDQPFPYGIFLQAVVTFLLTALIVFLLIVKPVNALRERVQGPPQTEPATTRECPECLSTIPKAAKRCSHCTAVVGPQT
jgi:large conductance mechanosensitive channel